MSTRDQTADQALDRLEGSAADIAVVRAELDGLRRARADDWRELQPLRAEVARLHVRLFASLGWDGRQDPSPSWDTLFAAVRDRTDERNELAAEVRRLQCRLDQHHWTTVPDWDPKDCPACQHADRSRGRA